MNPEGKNPCDVCKNSDNCLNTSCPLSEWTAKNDACWNSKCMLNNDATCMIGLYERCGAWEGENKEGNK